ncbi:unnamed protein product [Mucor hiemalis]
MFLKLAGSSLKQREDYELHNQLVLYNKNSFLLPHLSSPRTPTITEDENEEEDEEFDSMDLD